MKHIIKWVGVHRVSILVGTGILVWPILAVAHGWKAPSEAAKIPNPVKPTPYSIRQGGEIYGKLCAACHGVDGKGDGAIAGNLNPKPPDLIKRLGNHSDGDLFWKIDTGRGVMPGFNKQLSEKQIWQVIVFLNSLSKK